MSDRFAVLSVVRNGDGYVLGSALTADFVGVPEIGGRVAEWLRDGLGLDETARRAADLAGEPVDVAGFVSGLVGAGLLAAADAPAAAPAAEVSAGRRRLGRALFGPVGLGVQVALTVAGIVAMVAVPAVRPSSSAALASPVPLVSLAVLMVVGMALGIAHEFAHVLAAWAAGVTGRITFGRRMVALVLQTDLTRLWSVPRRRRIVPLAAGIVLDGAIVGAIVLAEAYAPWTAPAFLAPLARAAVFLNVTAVAYQFLIFLRTDVYALFLLATGCRNLWGTKDALLRRLLRRPAPEDAAALAAAGPRETAWARVFLALYVPGAAFTAWYFAVFALPAFVRLVTTAARAAWGDPWSLTGAAGALAFAFSAASMAFVLRGLVRSGIRVVRWATAGVTVSRPRSRPGV